MHRCDRLHCDGDLVAPPSRFHRHGSPTHEDLHPSSAVARGNATSRDVDHATTTLNGNRCFVTRNCSFAGAVPGYNHARCQCVTAATYSRAPTSGHRIASNSRHYMYAITSIALL